MTNIRILGAMGLTAALAACSSGDITLAPTNISTGGGSGGGGGGTNPCATYTTGGTTRAGTFDGTNCTYDSTFVSDTNPLLVDVRIPFIIQTVRSFGYRLALPSGDARALSTNGAARQPSSP